MQLDYNMTHTLGCQSMAVVGRSGFSELWLVYAGTSKNGTAFGLQMSQAGFSAHNVEVRPTSATSLSHNIFHIVAISGVS